MTINIVNQSFGPLSIDIANVIAEKGLSVQVFTGQVNKVQFDLNPKIKLSFLARLRRKSNLTRLFSWLVFSLQLLLKVVLSPRKSKWLITTNPPIAPWFAPLLKWKGSKIAILVYDIYPEILEASNIVSTKNLVFKFWQYLNKKSYIASEKIISIGETMTSHLNSYGFAVEKKIVTIPNWNVIRFDEPDQNLPQIYRQKRGAENKLHVVYSGNLGASHDFKTILKVAQTLGINNGIVFSIIGEGAQKKLVQDFIKENRLNNIVWEPFKPPYEVQDVFLSADISLVTLGSGIEKWSIPSKTYDAIAAGSALLVIAPQGSELENLVLNGKIGKCFNPGNVEGVVSWLKELSENKEELMKYKKAAKELSREYSPKNAHRYFELINSF